MEKKIGYIIQLLHLLLILFIIFGSFYNNILIRLLHLILSLTILFHWISNDQTCCLTIIEEHYITHENKQNGFLYRLLNPLFSENFMKQYINQKNISYYSTLFMIIIIIYDIYQLLQPYSITQFRDIYNELNFIKN